MKLAHHTMTWPQTITRVIIAGAIVTGVTLGTMSIVKNAQPSGNDYIPGFYGPGVPSEEDVYACQVIRSTQFTEMEVIYDPATDRWLCESK